MTTPDAEATVLALEKPHQDLWTYYLISSLAYQIGRASCRERV